jgi:hypothetical protein
MRHVRHVRHVRQPSKTTVFSNFKHQHTHAEEALAHALGKGNFAIEFVGGWWAGDGHDEANLGSLAQHADRTKV